ncbi:MAG TPA: VOC family protein [Thermoanaerobaculia bacterium]|nr:VOC family protein [Thermoanaerobaculia bacterium]
MTAKAIPEGYHTVTPFLLSSDAAAVLDFAKRAFGASEVEKHENENGQVRHAAIRVGDSMIMLGQAGDDYPAMQSMLHLYVPDVDAMYKRAVEAGGKSVREPKDEFYGDRSAGVADSTGNLWWIATHVEDVSPEEMERRIAAAGP